MTNISAKLPGSSGLHHDIRVYARTFVQNNGVISDSTAGVLDITLSAEQTLENDGVQLLASVSPVEICDRRMTGLSAESDNKQLGYLYIGRR